MPAWRAVYITYYPDLAVPGAAEAVGAFARLAVGNGVRRLVLLSGRGEEEAQHAEQAAYCFGRRLDDPALQLVFAEFQRGFSRRRRDCRRQWCCPSPAVAEPFVDVDDIADVAAVALTEDGHVGQLYELTGPRLLTFREATAEIAKAAGRDIRYVEVPTDDYLAAVAADGLPQELVGLVAELFTKVLDGRNAHLTDGVSRALGRQPRDFADYAKATAATGIWEGKL